MQPSEPVNAFIEERRREVHRLVEGALLHLEIESEDSASLRAAVNSYLRWVKVAAGAAEAGERARAANGKGAPPGRKSAKGK